jgi:hypothetical protein
MTITKRQKRLLTIFFVGLAALLIDRVFLRPQGGPSAASADSSPSVEGSVSLVENLPVLDSPTQGLEVAQRLDSLRSDEELDLVGVRNPFSLPASWHDEPQERPKTIPDAAAAFARTHRLTAVARDEPRSYALVDNHFLTPGQDIDGFRLIAVRDRSAVFERDGKQVVLELVDK